jgi:hypothetical protein
MTLRLAMLVAALPLAAAATSPMETLLAAIAAEKAAPMERVRMFVQRDGVADIYYIDQIRPGRTHLIQNPRQGGLEFIIVDAAQYVRTAGGWRKSPAESPAAAGAPDLANIIKEGLRDATETAQPDGSRAIEGSMSWSSNVSCTGKLTAVIDRGGRPALLHFDGACGGKPAMFREAFSFDGPVTIDAPR